MRKSAARRFFFERGGINRLTLRITEIGDSLRKTSSSPRKRGPSGVREKDAGFPRSREWRR